MMIAHRVHITMHYRRRVCMEVVKCGRDMDTLFNRHSVSSPSREWHAVVAVFIVIVFSDVGYLLVPIAVDVWQCWDRRGAQGAEKGASRRHSGAQRRSCALEPVSPSLLITKSPLRLW